MNAVPSKMVKYSPHCLSRHTLTSHSRLLSSWWVYLEEISSLMLLIFFPQGLGVSCFNLKHLLPRIFVTCILLCMLSWYILGKIHYASAMKCSHFQRITFWLILTYITPMLHFRMFSYFIISNIVVPNWI